MIIKLMLVDVYIWLGTHYRNTLWARKWNLATILLAVMACTKLWPYLVAILHEEYCTRNKYEGQGQVITSHSICALTRSVKLRVAHAPGMPVTFSPPSWVSNLDTHHGTRVTHVPWCMPGSLTSGFLWSLVAGKTFPAFPAHAQPAILRIWQVAHGRATCNSSGDECFVKWVHRFPSQFQ